MANIKRRIEQKTKFHTFFDQMKILVEDPRAVILTDEEIWTLVNGELAYEDRIAYSTFEKWKAPNGPKRVETIAQISDQEAAEFRQCLSLARAKQKMSLAGNMLDAKNTNQWGASWVLERKFEDLKKQPTVQLNSNPSIHITAGDKEGQALIDQIINGEVIDINHEEEDNRRIEE